MNAYKESKPCPFCGGKVKIMISANGMISIGCENQKCIARHMFSRLYESVEEAVKAWNTRAYESESTLLTKVKSLIASLEREADMAEVAYVHYGDAENRAEYCAYKDAARRLREITGRNNDAN